MMERQTSIDAHSEKSAGFTLLEVMVCIAIIATVLAATLKLHAQTVQMSGDSKFYTVAPLLAEQKLAEIDSNPNDNLFDGSGGFGENFPDYQWQVVVTPVDSGILGETAERLKCIDLTVSYKNGEAVFHSKAYRIVDAN